MPIDFSQFQKKQEYKKIVQKPIMTHEVETKLKVEREKIFGDKDMNKEELGNWFIIFIQKNLKQFTSDWLRGQKMTWESVNEMRKIK